MTDELMRFQDSIDACTWAREWVEATALADVTEDARPSSRRISTLSFSEEDGGVIAYFRDDRPAAVAVILRDTWNYSVAVKVLGGDGLQKADASHSIPSATAPADGDKGDASNG